MRIALFHNLPSGGAKRHTYEQVRELAARGHEVHEFTQSTADLEFMPFGSHGASSNVYDLPWTTLRRIPVPGVGPYVHWWQNARNLARLDRQSRTIATDIDMGGFDLAFVKDCRFVTAPMVMRHLRLPTVYYMHSVPDRPVARGMSHSSLARNLLDWPSKQHAQMIDRAVVRNLRCATRILTNSYFTREIRLLRDGIDSHVVYPGVDTHTFRPADGDAGDYVVSVGALLPIKGHEFVIEALGHIPAPIRPVLVIAAASRDEEMQAQMEQHAARHYVTLKVVCLRESAEMAQLYANAMLLAFAPVMEWLGLVALEAMACGIPVVGVREGGLRETVQHGVTGFLVERDHKEFAAAVQRLIEDSSLRRQMGQQARKCIEGYWTWPRAVDDLEKQFAAVLG
jgi:glycosyltransferase involved in cell wall biosynthesis